MDAAVVGVAGGQKLKKITMTINAQATTLIAMPKNPGTLKGPQYRPVFPAAPRDDPPIPPVQRRHRRSAQQMRYEEKSPLTVSEITSLKATDEPMLIRARRHVKVVVKKIAYRGNEVRRLIYPRVRNV